MSVRSNAGERVAVVTGANQGLGLAIVRGLAQKLAPGDIVYLTARSTQRGEKAAETLRGAAVRVVFERIDVTEAATIDAFAAALRDRHGGVDIVISNAAARLTKDPQERQVRAFVETNNHGSYRFMNAITPLLRIGARFVVMASVYGRLKNLKPHLHPLFDTNCRSLADIEATMDAYVEAVERGDAEALGWPTWINVASKVGQVASARIAARLLRETRPDDGILFNAICPGLVDTGASRPWADDMSLAQSPDEAARSIVDHLLAPPSPLAPHGKLLRQGNIVKWSDVDE